MLGYNCSYIDELLALRHVLLLLQDALIVLILWRGTYELKIGKKTVFIPIHSMATFVVTTTVVEIPQLMPAFFFISIAWILLASMDYRRQHPNAWSRCKSFRGKLQNTVLCKFEKCILVLMFFYRAFSSASPWFIRSST